jgi:NDP-sugar pyrophosphorylase family protein
MNPYGPEKFFDLASSPAAELFQGLKYVWEGVGALPAFIEKIIQPGVLGVVEEGAWLEPGRVQLGEGSYVHRGAIIYGPAIIGRNTVIRSSACLRGHVMIGDDCTIGHGVELRQLLVLNQVRIPHLNIILTSLVGNRAWIAGTAHTINFRLDGQKIKVRVPIEGKIHALSTGQSHFGSVIGDDSSVGVMTALQPGTIIGQRCQIYPNGSISGYIPHDSIVKPKNVPYEIISRV